MERGSRLQQSVLTFGPVGRVVATAVVLLPLAWFLYVGPFGLVGLVIWIGWILPRALRDIWRPAALPSTELTRLRDATRREIEHAARMSAEDVPSILERPAPTRW